MKKPLGLYSQLFAIFINCKWAQKARVLHYISVEKLSRDKQSSLLGPFIRGEENEVLWVLHLFFFVVVATLVVANVVVVVIVVVVDLARVVVGRSVAFHWTARRQDTENGDRVLKETLTGQPTQWSEWSKTGKTIYFYFYKY